jgi:hypothetical protein
VNDNGQNEGDGGRDTGRRLPSIFDGLPTDQPIDMAAIEDRMADDFERRVLAALERADAKRQKDSSPKGEADAGADGPAGG